MAMISSLCPLFVLVVVAVAAAGGSSGLSNVEKALANSVEELEPDFSRALSLLYNVFEQIKDYECNRGAADCDAWHAVHDVYMLEIMLQMSGLKCDGTEQGADVKLCEAAKELLGDREAGLFHAAQGLAAKDYPLLNAIREAVISYVCDKEANECKILRDFATDFERMISGRH